MKYLLFLLPAALWAQNCQLTITGPPGSTTVCVPPPAPISTITVSPDGGTTTIKGNVVVTGNLSTGSAGTATTWSVTRSDLKVCTMTFQPATPDATTTVIVIKCP